MIRAIQKLLGLALMLTLLACQAQVATVPTQSEVATAVADHVIYADSCSQTDVQAAIDAASDGDLVLVPAGNCTWTTPAPNRPSVSIDRKAITLQGAGIDQTIITDGTTTNGNETLLRVDGIVEKPFRITGFTFSKINRPAPVLIYGDCKHFRIDHCKFDNSIQDTADGIITSGDMYGVIDHCIFSESRLVVTGGGDAAWQQPLALGTENAVYIEDCYFDRIHGNVVDANNGGRYVFRANMVNNSYVEAGSNCDSLRATFSYEVYSNTLLASLPVYCPFLMRGGTGVIFSNVITGSYTSPDIHVDNQRSCMGEYYLTCLPPWDRCDGDSIYDGNQPGGYGYPCRDQIGRSTDSGRTTPQALEPLYEWDNTTNGVIDTDIVLKPFVCALTAEHIQEGRDFYNDTRRPGYTPYVYPHPLTWELALHGTSDNGAIHLDWAVHAALPPTSTWRITYYSETTPTPVVRTDIASSTHDYTLTGLVNDEWYTVMLDAMVGGTSWLSDTMRVMPTDRFVHLPVVLR